MMTRRVNDPKVCFQTGHTKGNGCGVNTENVAYTLESVMGGDGCDGHLPPGPGVEQLDEVIEPILRLPQRECVSHDRYDCAESVQGTGRHGDSGDVLKECWAWKHRNLMSFPKKDLADPCTATDYKDPDLIGYWS